MIDDVATEELARLGHDSDDPGILLTVTAGGNDLLDALAAGQPLDRERGEQAGDGEDRQRPPDWRAAVVAQLAREVVEDAGLDLLDQLQEPPRRQRDE